MSKGSFKKHNKNNKKHHQNGVHHQKPHQHNHNHKHSHKHSHNHKQPQQQKVVKNIAQAFPKEKLILDWKVKRSIGPGLVNAGNTCFLNSVLQCLTYSPAFTQYLLSSKHVDNCEISGFCALCSIQRHVTRVFCSEKSFKRGAALLPRPFTSNLRQISRLLSLGTQEDAHEFLTFLLQAFQKSFTYGIKKVTPQIEESTAISQIFGGKIRSQITCHNCHEKINNFEAFLDLSLDLTQVDTIERSLKNFTKIDIIGSDPENRYSCSKCKQKVQVGKKMTISQLPPMLTLHLKRFTYNPYRDSIIKIGRHVDFPETLDMAPYISKDDKEAVKGETNYDLYAVLVHAGRSTDSGHYYAYVKSPAGKWFLMNDEDVSPVHKKVVLSEKAYMVFYKQRDSGSKGEESVMVEGLTIATEEGALKSAVKRRRDQANEQEKVVPKKKKTVQIEDLPIADDPRSWFVRCTSDAHRSLRGVMSPATYGAAMSDDSAWAVNNTKNPQTKDKKKRFHRRKRLDGKSSHFKTSNQL